MCATRLDTQLYQLLDGPRAFHGRARFCIIEISIFGLKFQYLVEISMCILDHVATGSLDDLHAATEC